MEWLTNANWILDVILAIFLLIILIIGYKCGFLRAVIKIASLFGGFVVAILFTEPLAAKTIEWGLFDKLSNKISNNIQNTDAYKEYVSDGTLNTEALIQKLGIPEFLEKYFKDAFNTAAESFNINEALANVTNGITSVVATVVVFIFLLIFTGIAFWILKLVVKTLRDKVGIIRFADGVLGIALYALIGVIVIYAFLLVSSLIMQSNTNGFTEFMVRQLHLDDEKFGLAKWFYQNNYLGKFISLFL